MANKTPISLTIEDKDGHRLTFFLHPQEKMEDINLSGFNEVIAITRNN